jgi:hypothetical protein
VYICVQRFEERDVIVSFVEDHMLCIFVFRGKNTRHVILNKTNNHLSLLKPLDTKIHDM